MGSAPVLPRRIARALQAAARFDHLVRLINEDAVLADEIDASE
jgi:hypothetical protein